MPAPRGIDLIAKFNHLNDFARKLRLKVFFNNKNGAVADEALDQELDKMPWEQMSTFSPTPGKNEALQKIISELTSYLLNPQNRNEFKDNLSMAERGNNSFIKRMYKNQ